MQVNATQALSPSPESWGFMLSDVARWFLNRDCILKSHGIVFFLRKKNEERRGEYGLICFVPEVSLCVNVLNFLKPTTGNSGLPLWLSGKESSCNAGDVRDKGSVLGLGRSPGQGHGNPLQDSCLENPMDRGAWWVMVHRAAKSRTRLKRLSTQHKTFTSSQWAVEGSGNRWALWPDLRGLPQLCQSEETGMHKF